MQTRAPEGDGDANLQYYLGILGRRRWLILGVALMLGLVALGLALSKEDHYRASAQLLVRATTDTGTATESLSDEADRILANEVAILRSAEVQAQVAEQLPPGSPGVSAAASAESDVITLTAESTDPAAAQRAVNSYATVYQRFRRERTVATLRDELAAKQDQLRSTRAIIQRILQPLDQLQAQIDLTPPGPERDQLLVQRDDLQNRTNQSLDPLFGEQAELNDRIATLQRSIRDPAGGVELLSRAGLPSEPFYPQPKKDLVVGLTVGLLLGIGLTFVWEHLDDAIRTRAAAERAGRGTPVLGVVPRVKGWRDRTTTRVVTRLEPASAAAEAYNSLVTSIEFLAKNRETWTLVLSSPGASEGKTTTVANLGVAAAQLGYRAILVDGDLRRPRLHEFFDLGEITAGLGTVLSGQLDVTAAVLPVVLEGVEGRLDVLPAGPVFGNPAELLRSELTEVALVKCSEIYDLVIVDSPPLLPVADAVVLSRYADAVLVVAAADSTGRRALGQALDTLRRVNAPVVGVVLNSVSEANGYDYANYYGDDGKRSRRRRRAQSHR